MPSPSHGRYRSSQEHATRLLRRVRQLGSTSRSALAHDLDLSKPAVTRLVSDLILAGLLVEDDATSAAVGRPRQPLRIARHTRHVVGIDFRVDRVVADLVDFSGAVVASATISADNMRDPVAAVNLLAAVVRDLEARDRPAHAIGVSLPALLDRSRRVVIESVHLGWSNVDFGQMFNKALGSEHPPSVFAEVAQSAAYANLDRLRDERTTRLAHLQIGVGSGIGLAGYGSSPGSLGDGVRFAHIPLEPGGPACVCGAHGCVESLTAFPALVDLVKAHNMQMTSDPADLAEYCRELLRRSDDGETTAATVIMAVGERIGRAIAIATNAYGPDAFTLGGYPLLLGERLSSAAVDAATPYAPLAPQVLRSSPLGDDASRIGAARLALESASKHPL